MTIMSYSKKKKDEILKEIFRLISKEGLSIVKALDREGMPSRDTFYQWIDQDEVEADNYTRAYEERADIYFEEILDIADKQDKDVYLDQDGVEQTNHNVISRSKLMIDARKWMLGKMNSKKYGDKNTTILEGGEKPIQISFED